MRTNSSSVGDTVALADGSARLRIPHFALTVGDLPAPGASWDETVIFAESFDSHVVYPEHDRLQEFAVAARAAFARDGSLPEGLTMLRTALSVERRFPHFDNENLEDPDDMRYVHALIERIRALVVAGAHLSPSSTTVGGIRDKVMNAYERLLVGYASWGGWRYHGWGGPRDDATYHGPAIWSERDCALRFCKELEKEWPGAVHQEYPIAKYTRVKFQPPQRRVDVAVADFSDFVEGPDSAIRFRERQHEAFFEIKWCVKGWSDNSRELKSRREAIPVDIAKLANYIKQDWCTVAGMLVFDDGCWFQHQELELDGGWPKDVWRLYVGPWALRWRGLIPPTQDCTSNRTPAL